MSDRDRFRLAGDGDELGCRLETAEEVRLLEDDGGRVTGRFRELLRVGRAAPMRYLDHLEAEAGRVGLDDLPNLRTGCLGHDDLRPAGDVLDDVARVGCHRGAVVAGGV